MNAEQLFTRLPSPVSGRPAALAIVNGLRSNPTFHLSTLPTFHPHPLFLNQPHLFLKQLTRSILQ
jgi:hypothetical protein